MENYSKEKIYQKLTKSILDINNIKYNEGCLAQGFSVIGENQKHGILVFGINPGGDEKDAEFDEEYPTYFNYVDGINNPKISNSNFYKKIYDVFNEITGDNVKWDWCNYSETDIDDKIGSGVSDEEKSKVKNFYNDHKTKEYTIYIGEFFYYHKTSQSEFLELIDSEKDKNEYIKAMLNKHIYDIERKNNKIDCIYINNATASHWVCDAVIGEDRMSSLNYFYPNDKKHKIFLGSMLSGQRSMDVFSRERLVSEIKANLFPL